MLAFRLLLLGLFVHGAMSHAQSAPKPSFDSVWSAASLYESDNPDSFLHSVTLSGRLQADAALFDADQGRFEDLLWRRFRFGFKAELGENWLLHIEGDWDLNANTSRSDDDTDESFNRFTDAYVAWTPRENLQIKVFKQSVGFTLDGATSSTKLLTLQRNNLTNNLWFTSEYFTGVSVAGETESHWGWKAGLYSAESNEDFGLFEAGAFTLLSLGRDFSDALSSDRADIRVDYVRNKEREGAQTPDLSQVASLSTKLESGSWGLWSDFALGNGYGELSDMRGLTLMPFSWVSPRLQAVLRYTWLESSEDNGVRLGRYEREIVEERGDEYQEFYAGLNVFFYGHKLKWQTGLQYAQMQDAANDGGAYRGWGVTTGLRAYW
ncbi:porin [Congregibacter sp.]|uniref:porin n=1 Tax=Congregibacter sp. TaxID=2744308 RepID=UPI003F6D5BA7